MAVHHLITSMPGYFLGALPVFGLPLLGYATGGPGQPLLRNARLASRTSLLQYHDRGDAIIPWRGGEDSDGWLYETLEIALGTWAALKGCDASARNLTTPLSGGTSKVACYEYAGCAAGAVRWCMNDGGHGAWPAPRPAADDYAWAFFESLLL